MDILLKRYINFVSYCVFVLIVILYALWLVLVIVFNFKGTV